MAALRRRVPLAALVAGLCGLALPAPTAAARPATSATIAGTSATDTPADWPAVVAEAMNYAQRRTSVPPEAPRALPRAGPVPSSAQVSARPSEYSVALYGCRSALPVNHPGIGVGTCGTMADYYGYFQGNAYDDPGGGPWHFAPARSCLPRQVVSTAGCRRHRHALLRALAGGQLRGSLARRPLGLRAHRGPERRHPWGRYGALAPGGQRARLLPTRPLPARGPRLRGVRHRRRRPAYWRVLAAGARCVRRQHLPRRAGGPCPGDSHGPLPPLLKR